MTGGTKNIMNPFEMIDIREKQMFNSIPDKGLYDSEDIKRMINQAFNFARQAYMNGEFIFELENVNSEKVTIDGATFRVSKMLANDNKYNMIVQMLDVPEGDMTQSDMSQLANVLKQATHKNPNINGVILLPPNYEITLMSAKLNTSDYEVPVELSEEDIKNIESMGCRTPLRGLRSRTTIMDDGSYLEEVESLLSEKYNDDGDLPWDE